MSRKKKTNYAPTDSEAESLYQLIKKDAENSGYSINPDQEFVMMLMKGLLVNQERYGYLSCPCRLADGSIELDNDIICPCDYRDPDLSDYEACYCALYVSRRVVSGEYELKSIPERRPPSEERSAAATAKNSIKNMADIDAPSFDKLSYPVWRCKVCGYLCARDEPPEICPICKVKKERFEKFL